MLLRLTLLIALALVGACDGGGGATVELRASELAGEWLVSLTTTSLIGSECNSGSAVGKVVQMRASIISAGSVATIELEDGRVIELDLVGSRAVGTSVTASDDGGLTRRTETSMDLRVSGARLSGSFVVDATRGDGATMETLCREEAVVSGERQFVAAADFGGGWDVAVLVLPTLGNHGSEMPHVSRLQLVQEGSTVRVEGYGSLLSADNNGNVFGVVTGNRLRLVRLDGFTDLTLTMDQDGRGFRGEGWLRHDNTGAGAAGGAVWDTEVVVTASPSFPTSAQMWLNFESGLWDASSNGFSGHPMGGFTIDTTMGVQSERSGAFDGWGDGVRVHGGMSINVGQPFSFGVWVHPESHGSFQTILAKRPRQNVSTAGLRTAELYLRDGRVVYGYHNGVTLFANVIPLEEWSHVGVVYDGVATHTIFINGVEVASHHNMPAANEGQNGEGTWPLSIGQPSSQSILGFQGNLDDVTYWARALSPGEMRVLHRQGPDGM